MTHSRRSFLRRTGFAALGATAFASSYERLGLISALAQANSGAADYRAMVCIFLFGGNDGNNMVIPIESGAYSAYATTRGELAIPRTDLLPLAASGGGNAQYALHPGMSELQPLWNEGRIAVLSNVGTLIEPITRAQYLSGIGNPDSLFSHSDQQAQWQSSISRGGGTSAPLGWGGRVADRTVRLNGAATFPMIISVAGSNLFTTGMEARPLVPSVGLRGFDSSTVSTARYDALRQLLALDTDGTLVRSVSDTTTQSIINTQTLNSALASSGIVQTPFPTSGLGKQMQQVAKIIAARSTLGLKRQIFFCSLGGFDTHNSQLTTQASLLTQLSGAMSAFYASTVELGISTNVTTFTLSDFGRTLKPASGAGTDHAWGSHHLIMGGGVRGGNLYGSYPTLALSGPDDAGKEGRWIPTTSVDQYAATLASWYGLADSDLTTVFPNLGRFATPNLGFML